AAHIFADEFTPDEINRWLKVFLKRFFSQQFKRSCMPDGPTVFGISLSPRGGWTMPSDISSAIWLKDLE
ncbi:MAG TPA: NAD(+) synthase, partial [Bacteroidales bacterium]|nr:NAD(+) synthase [Bacteroidales bacterium]